MTARFWSFLGRFRKADDGAIAMQFAIFSLPLMLLVGAAVDYGSANRTATRLQVALDAAVLQAAAATGDRESIGRAALLAHLGVDGASGEVAVAFTDQGNGLRATAAMYAPTTLMKLAGVEQVAVSRSAYAAYGTAGTPGPQDNSCILAFGGGLDVSGDAIIFNGGASAALAGCVLRTNRSMKCNGQDAGDVVSLATGSLAGCSNPQGAQAPVPDAHAALASNITRHCDAASSGADWIAGEFSLPSGNLISVARDSHIELHVCGDLRLSGTGQLASLAPEKDMVVVIENGSLRIAHRSDITASRVTFVLAGGSDATTVVFPNGNGRAAKLTVSASTSPGNPWKGIGIYQNPLLTAGIDIDWQAGASLALDGIAYFPNANVTLRGHLAAAATGCSKLVAGTLTLNGSVDLKQSPEACAAMQVTQHVFPGTAAVPVRLVQ